VPYEGQNPPLAVRKQSHAENVAHVMSGSGVQTTQYGYRSRFLSILSILIDAQPLTLYGSLIAPAWQQFAQNTNRESLVERLLAMKRDFPSISFSSDFDSGNLEKVEPVANHDGDTLCWAGHANIDRECARVQRLDITRCCSY
jgi:hypothetical protein